MIGDVAGDKDRVQWPGQTVQVGHDGGGPVEAALAAVQMSVAELREDDQE